MSIFCALSVLLAVCHINLAIALPSDGTAFEVKDPRRLEQDILPKYFRHSRFQSLVRQLNFYSFKKISKVCCFLLLLFFARAPKIMTNVLVSQLVVQQ